MGYVFISYSRRQLYFAESVTLYLQKAGVEVWFDLQQISPGEIWNAELEQGYRHCDKLILIASQAAIQSPYVQVEWESALSAGREIIIVLAEAVNLPPILRECAVYDARNRFDQIIQHLISYLRGEQSARHDRIPNPDENNYPLVMPFDIWLTVFVLFLISFFELAYYLNRVRYHNFFQDYSKVQFCFLEFWKHNTSRTVMARGRFHLLSAWILAPLFGFIILLFLLSSISGVQASYLVPIGLSGIIAYWVFRVWNGSPDILRWLPPEVTDQKMRERIQARILPLATVETRRKPTRRVLYALHYHPADGYNARYIDSVLGAGGCQAVAEDQAGIQLILVSNRTSKQWLLERNACLPGRIIHILTTNISVHPQIQALKQTQWFDFRSGQVESLQAFAGSLIRPDGINVGYGLQMTPTGFASERSWPPVVGLVAWTIMITISLVSVAVAFVFGWIGWIDWIMVVAWGIALGYTNNITQRDSCLPAFLHRFLGHRLAWFASPAPAAADAIGNSTPARDTLIYP